MAPTLNKTATQTNQGSQIESLQKIGALIGQVGLTADQIAKGYAGTSDQAWLNNLFGKDKGVLSRLFGSGAMGGTTTDTTGGGSNVLNTLPEGSYQTENGTYLDPYGNTYDASGTLTDLSSGSFGNY